MLFQMQVRDSLLAMVIVQVAILIDSMRLRQVYEVLAMSQMPISVSAMPTWTRMLKTMGKVVDSIRQIIQLCRLIIRAVPC